MDNEVKEADELFDSNEQNARCENKRNNHKLNLVVTGLTSLLFLVAIIAYLLIGILLGIWSPTWLIFFAPILIASLVTAIGYKNAYYFNYPILVVVSFLLFGMLYGLWHPLWVLFITVPLYYSIIDFIKKIKKTK